MDRETRWEMHYKEAEKYYNEHGNLLVPFSYKVNEFKLGRWIDTQRQKRKKKELSEERIRMLEKIGMFWGNEKNFIGWDENYKIAKTYYRENGNLEIKRDYMKDGVNVGIWLNEQRFAYKRGKLSKDKIDLLEELGVAWDPIEKSWQEHYEIAKEYYEEVGHLLIRCQDSYKGKKLGEWLRHQRRKKRQGKLTKEKIDLLNDIGMVWDVYYKKKKINQEEK